MRTSPVNVKLCGPPPQSRGFPNGEMVRHFGTLTIVNAGTLQRAQGTCLVELDSETAVAEFFEFGLTGQVEPVAKPVSLQPGTRS